MDVEPIPEWLHSMRDAYVSSAETKLADLSIALKMYLDDSSNVDLQHELHQRLHNLIGSGGSYGFPAVSEEARAISDALKSWRESRTPLHSALLDQLAEAMNRLYVAFGVKNEL